MDTPTTEPVAPLVKQPELIQPTDADILHHLFGEVFDDIALGKKVIAAYRTGGKDAAIALIPEVALEAKEDFDAIKEALPLVKSGMKSSEFWINFGVIGVIAGFVYTGHPLPVAETVAISGIAMVYNLVRGLIKAKAVPASAVVNMPK